MPFKAYFKRILFLKAMFKAKTKEKNLLIN